MATLNDLTDGIKNRIIAGFSAGTLWDANQPCLADISVLVQDAADIENEIDAAVKKIGLLCLINMPSFRNNDPLANTVNGVIKLIVEIGEEPLVWRDAPLTKPTAKDVAQLCARMVQGFFIPGFQPLRVVSGDFQKDKKRQVYFLNLETMHIFEPVNF